MCSHQHKILDSKGMKKRRKRRKKKERPKALQALEKKAGEDSEVLAAVKQVREFWHLPCGTSVQYFLYPTHMCSRFLLHRFECKMPATNTQCGGLLRTRRFLHCKRPLKPMNRVVVGMQLRSFSSRGMMDVASFISSKHTSCTFSQHQDRPCSGLDNTRNNLPYSHTPKN